MAETIAVLSLKGGTGKTTTVRTLADVLRRVGLDVLAVDLDPQGNLSDYFDVPPDATPDGRRRALRRRQGRRGRRTTASSPPRRSWPRSSARCRARWAASSCCARRSRTPRKQHDVILIDCPPALGLLTINGLVAADWALVSSEAQYFALQGVEGALEVIEQAKEFYNPDLEWLGVVLNIADMRTTHSRDAYDAAAGALRRQGLRDGDPRLDRLRRVGREGAARSSITGPISARTTSRWPTRSWRASGSPTPAASSSRCAPPEPKSACGPVSAPLRGTLFDAVSRTRVFHCDDSGSFLVLVRHWLEEHDDIEWVGSERDRSRVGTAAAASGADVVLLDTMGRPGDGELIRSIRAAARTSRSSSTRATWACSAPRSSAARRTATSTSPRTTRRSWP